MSLEVLSTIVICFRSKSRPWNLSTKMTKQVVVAGVVVTKALV